MSDPRDDIIGVVLCGGQSRRMGRDKASMRTPDGRTWLDTAVCRLRTVVAEVVVSGSNGSAGEWKTIADAIIAGRSAAVPARHRPGKSPRGDFAAKTVAEGSTTMGPIAGILASLRHASSRGASGILVTPIDVPNLTTADARSLLPDESDEMVIGYTDRTEPLLGYYPASVLNPLARHIERGDLSPRRFVESTVHRRVSLDRDRARNFNRPEDLDTPSP